MRAWAVLIASGLALSATGCQTTSVAVTTPSLAVAPQRPRWVTWKPVEIRRESADRYVMTGKGRDNLKDNLADIARNQEQWGFFADYYQSRKPAK